MFIMFICESLLKWLFIIKVIGSSDPDTLCACQVVIRAQSCPKSESDFRLRPLLIQMSVFIISPVRHLCCVDSSHLKINGYLRRKL